jgi:8-hydroxy-5-deazaflavin:NADPH oxidoreductase
MLQGLALIAKLVGDLGFAPIDLGKINEGGMLLQGGEPLVLQNLVKLDEREAA